MNSQEYDLKQNKILKPNLFLIDYKILSEEL